MGEPDFGCVTRAIKSGGFQDAQGHAAAQNDDGLSVVERIFHHEPAAQVKETENKSDQQQKAKRTGVAPVPSARCYIRGRKIISKSHRVNASYLAMARWSIGGAQATLANWQFWRMNASSGDWRRGIFGVAFG